MEPQIPKINPPTEIVKPKRFAWLRKKPGKPKKVVLGILVFFLLLFLLLAIPGYLTYAQGRKLANSGRGLQTALESQNIEKVKASLIEIRGNLKSFQKSYRLFSWLKIIPFVGAYVKDGDALIKAGVHGLDAAEITIEVMEPYADIIGFSGGNGQAKSGEETANDRIEFIVESINSVTPRLDEIAAQAQTVQSEIGKINPARYPKKIAGRQVRSNLEKMVDLANEATYFVVQSKPLLEAAPYLLGVDSERTYLVLFQNDKELRPTGGFITAYSIMSVAKGKTESVSSNDIYNLDARYRPSVPAPQPIIDYIKGPYALSKNLRLRDMNFNPDFKESMKLFTEEAAKAGIKDIDGGIAVDTQVLVNLLDVLGEIGVPGYGNFSTKIVPECDCPQVIYELESFADIEGPVVWDPLNPDKIIYAPANYDNRKKIVGPLMNSILSNTLGQPKEKLPDLFAAGFKSLREKHVLLYMFDEKAQAGVESFGIAGTLRTYEGDYLHINDANLGGRKSNLYVTQEVRQDVKIGKDGSLEKTVEITYKNPQTYDGWLNSVLPNWTRVYVPRGSKLISQEGFEDEAPAYEENGKTVFAGGFELRPQGVKKVILKYTLPFKVKGEYKLLVQKQPGTDAPLYTIAVGKNLEELFLKADKEFKFRI